MTGHIGGDPDYCPACRADPPHFPQCPGPMEETVSTPKLDPTPRRGDPRCGRRLPGQPPCGEPATWHIAWHFTPAAEFSLACDTHMATVAAEFVWVDRHPAAANCDMPGTGWLPVDPSRCVLPDSDNSHAAHLVRATH